MNGRKLLTDKKVLTNWVQTERATHVAWAALIGKAPKTTQLMHLLTDRVGDNNTVVIT